MKSLPGTHANQNVPRSVVPVSFRVRLYCQDVADSCVDEKVALAASAAAAGAAAQAHAIASREADGRARRTGTGFHV